MRTVATPLGVERVHAGNYGVYGAEKVWRSLRREGVEVGRDRTARLMAGWSALGEFVPKMKADHAAR